eukprot:TRINITY_DN33550_c0_g2_i5.p1 TRINITY_DN33550_c0_g2~~TRINITY_DN33550_c0_g2_i5.p1  ORF type:complete len:224 (+),score=18.35 TRINITY_DN33550_c0_g2_i5:82-753(+)
MTSLSVIMAGLQRDQKSLQDEDNRSDSRTTVIVKDLACRECSKDVIRAVDALGFEGTYDFLYVSTRYRSTPRLCYGYAIINFKANRHCQLFLDTFEGMAFNFFKGSKVPSVFYAHVQGEEAMKLPLQHSQTTSTWARVWQEESSMIFESAPARQDIAAAPRRSQSTGASDSHGNRSKGRAHAAASSNLPDFEAVHACTNSETSFSQPVPRWVATVSNYTMYSL